MEPTRPANPPHLEPDEITDLRSAATRVRELVAAYDREQDAAWQAYAHSVDRALVHLEIELEVSAAHLGELDARDLVGASYERANQDLAHAGAAIQSTIDALVHLPATAAHDLAPIRDRATRGVTQLRSALFGLRLALSRSEPPSS